MELIGHDGKFTLPILDVPMKSKKLTKRAILLIRIAELTGMTEILNKNFWAFANKFSHLKGDEGYKVLNWIYETAMCESGEEDGKWRRIKFWTLIKESKDEKDMRIV
jgi:hypothetical protein